MARHNLEGLKFNRLTVRKYLRNRGIHPIWECVCECGNITQVAATKLKSGSTKSCGCLKTEVLQARGLESRRKYPREYEIWKTMRQRCSNPNNPKHANYGLRGIEVCSEWDTFDTFVKEMGEAPSEKHSIGRIDNDKGYFAENCRWENAYQQANNTRKNKHLTFAGKTLTYSQWEREIGVGQGTVKSRIYRGWSVEKALGKTLTATAV